MTSKEPDMEHLMGLIQEVAITSGDQPFMTSRNILRKALELYLEAERIRIREELERDIKRT